MDFFHALTGTLGYSAIGIALVLAVLAHFFAPRSWSALAWVIAFGVLGAAFIGQRGLTSAEQLAHERTRGAHAQQEAQRAQAAFRQSEINAGKRAQHATSTQEASDVFTQAQPRRAADLRADLDRSERLRRSADRRAAHYRELSEADAAARSDLANRCTALDGQLVEGLAVVGALRGDLARRDAEIVFLLSQIGADRKLMAGP